MKKNHNRKAPKPDPSHISRRSPGSAVLSELTPYQRRIAELLLGQLKDEHPEWMKSLEENGELVSFLDVHVRRASARFGYGDPAREAALKEEPLILLINLADYMMGDPLLRSQRRLNCPEYVDVLDGEEDDADAADVQREVAASPETTGRLLFPTEGYSLEWGNDGLRIQTIDYHATELLMSWDTLAGMAEGATGYSLKETIKQTTGVHVPGITSGLIRHVGRSGGGFHESKIVRAVAEHACQRIRRATVAHLRRLTNGLLASGDSGLGNAWDAICVEVQLGRSRLWDAYDRTVRSLMATQISELQPFEREAVWLQTVEGRRWVRDAEEDRDPPPVVNAHIVNYIADFFVYWEAFCWSPRGVRTYVERHIHG